MNSGSKVSHDKEEHGMQCSKVDQDASHDKEDKGGGLLTCLPTYQCAQLGDVDAQRPVQLLDEQCQRLLCACARHSWQSEKTPRRSPARLALSGSSQQQGPAPYPSSPLHRTLADVKTAGQGGIKARYCGKMYGKLKEM